jgi:hypothetical protein
MPYHPGTSRIYANVTFTMSGDLVLRQGNCSAVASLVHSACDRKSQLQVYGYAEFIDRSTNQYTNPTTSWPGLDNFTYHEISCNSAGCRVSHHGSSGPVSTSSTFSWVFAPPTKMVKSDRYVLELTLYAQTFSECYTLNAALTGCYASSSLNSATLGNGLVLSSITEA